MWRSHAFVVIFIIFHTYEYVCVKGIHCSDVLKAVEILLTSYRLREFVFSLRGVYSDTTQLNSTQPVVGHDVIDKNTTDLLRADWLYAVQLGQLS